jgi:hypothetical protein
MNTIPVAASNLPQFVIVTHALMSARLTKIMPEDAVEVQKVSKVAICGSKEVRWHVHCR